MLTSILLFLLALATAVLAQQPLNTTQFNTTREFLLKILVKPNQASNCAVFDNLYLTSYHTAAGQSDPVFTNESSSARPFFLTFTNVTGFERIYYETGNDFPWTLNLPVTGFYDGWQPVWMQAVADAKVAGDGLSPIEAAAAVNENGLEWSTAPGVEHGHNEFSGWLVCDWAHGMPQL